jgi:hypothetical protein
MLNDKLESKSTKGKTAFSDESASGRFIFAAAV